MTQSAKRFAAFYFLGCCLLMVFASLAPHKSGLVLVVSKPWGDPAAEVISRAGGRIVFIEGTTWLAVADGTDQAFVSKLYAAGAGFVASSLIAQACARLNGISLERTL
ncbi:hypothetical protein E1180_06455 [Roseibium denhamense]|uniref:Uncharacterized protein n=1 Tax=Roseibium denhamense TaxID=76305 RepID=A0ABY1NZJ0_9HYPH|nr:hypothetical protein [Roseibium denhamense]MTI05154.1 hypothetical protein [Roseibium denhamense]SMP22403.1 hypothetical protein SAMN06265374_2162 [Roseibium denhamense]